MVSFKVGRRYKARGIFMIRSSLTIRVKPILLPEYTTGDGEIRNRENPDQYLDLGPLPQKYEIDPAVPGSGWIFRFGYSRISLSRCIAFVGRSYS